jgi:hypothetical protein
VVLGYIKSCSERFELFVSSNRVSVINHLTDPTKWYYVHTKENPADYASRDIIANNPKVELWAKGPSFLRENPLVLPEPDQYQIPSNDVKMAYSKGQSVCC